jgi:hypothetical protein
MSASEPLREPCLHCGEPAALAARICPHCSRSLLVDVRLVQGLRDGRAVHGLARALSRLGPGALPLPELQKTLPRPRALICRGVTREYARKALDVAKSFGAPGDVAPHRAAFGVIPENLPWKPIAAGAAGLLVAVGVALVVLSRDGADRANATDPGPVSLTTAQIAATSGPSTVSLTCGAQGGSGFFVTADRVVTNAHVVCKDPTVQVHFASGRQVTGTVVSRHDKLDLAVVEVEDSGAAPLTVGDAALLEPGDKVVIIGAPLGMDQTVLEGIVSHVGRTISGVGYIQLDANINPGNSGGPVFNERGELVAVVTLKADAGDGMGFALPINYVHDGNPPLVALSLPGSNAWQKLLAQVRESEARERERAATVFEKPALIAARLPSNHPGVVVVILKRSPVQPARDRLEVVFERDGDVLCQSYIDVRDWRSLDDMTGQMEGDLPPDVLWLKENDQGNQLWYGPGTMGSNNCSGENLLNADAVLQDAEPGFERTTVARLDR